MDEELEAKIKEENKRLHDFSAHTYDNWPPYIEQQNQKIFFDDMKRIKGLVQNDRPLALECGCGTGKMTINLLKTGFEVCALDISSEMVKRAAAKVGAEGLGTDKVRFHVGDIDEFLKDGKKYDMICFVAVLHHIGDYLKTVRLSLPYVKKGGAIYILDGQLQTGKRLRHRIMDFMYDKSIIAYKLFRNPRNSLNFVKKKLSGRKGGEAFDPALAEFHAGKGIDEDALVKILHEGGFEIVSHERFMARPFRFFEIFKALEKDRPMLFKIIAQKR